jgi:hypothetical protein
MVLQLAEGHVIGQVSSHWSDYRSRRLSSMVLQLAEGHVIGQVSSHWSDYQSRRFSSMVLQLAEGHVIGQVSSHWSDYRSRRLSSVVLQLAEGHVIGQVSSHWFGIFLITGPHWSLSTRSPNPFLFIRGLSCPSCIQASLSLNCLKLTTVFLYLW